jgi:hypothetical protein
MNIMQFQAAIIKGPPIAPGDYVVHLRDGRQVVGTYEEFDAVSELVTISGEIIDINMIVSMKKPA